MVDSEYSKKMQIKDDISPITQLPINLFNEKHWSFIRKRFSISPRELEVSKYICHGYTNSEIANKLRMRPGTVKTHLRSIFAKTHVNRKIRLLLLFEEEGHNEVSCKSSSNDTSSCQD